MPVLSRTFGSLADLDATLQRGDDTVRLDLNLEDGAAPSQATIDEVDAMVGDQLLVAKLRRDRSIIGVFWES